MTRILLWPASVIYELIIRVRNMLYTAGILRSHRLDVPVISVGNITTGGTGKTPMVIDITRRLEARGRRVGVVLRGYGQDSSARVESDETMLLRDALPSAHIVVDADRVRGGRRAIDEHGVDVIVLDDAFQHRRIRRHLDVVLVDASNPFGGNMLLPAGRLREPVGALRRADIVCLTRAEMCGSEYLGRLGNRVAKYVGAERVMTARHEAVEFYDRHGKLLPRREILKKPVFVLSALARNSAFEQTVRSMGAQIAGVHFERDHHRYTIDELDAIVAEADGLAAGYVVTTEKDWVKLRRLEWPVKTAQPAVLRIGMRFDDADEARLDQVLRTLTCT